MGFLDKAKRQADRGGRQARRQDRAGHRQGRRVVDKKTGGKHADKIDKGDRQGRDALDKLDGKNDDIPTTSRCEP